jgi:hypothetical protein
MKNEGRDDEKITLCRICRSRSDLKCVRKHQTTRGSSPTTHYLNDSGDCSKAMERRNE